MPQNQRSAPARRSMSRFSRQRGVYSCIHTPAKNYKSLDQWMSPSTCVHLRDNRAKWDIYVTPPPVTPTCGNHRVSKTSVCRLPLHYCWCRRINRHCGIPQETPSYEIDGYYLRAWPLPLLPMVWGSSIAGGNGCSVVSQCLLC